MSALELGKYRPVLQPLEPLALPAYKGATLRGGFGTVFRRVACACGAGATIHQENCLYARVKDATLRLSQYQKANNPTFCLAFAKQLIHGKIHNALVFTQRQRGRDAEIDRILGSLRQALRQLETASSLESVRGFEGAASAAFYRAFRKFLKHDLGFQTRVHHPPTDPVNILLSLGYTLLYNHTFAAINVVGLDPYLGFFHQSRHGHATLASDLMEEWRTLLVDSLVLGLINRGELGEGDFRTHAGGMRLRHGGLTRFLTAYDERVRGEIMYPPTQQRLPYLRCIELQVRHAAEVLTEQQPRYMPYNAR